MATTTRTTTQVEQDRAKTASMVIAGMGHGEIAETLGVSRQQVTYDMRIIRERWKARTTIALDDAKAQEVVKIDRLEQVYWDAWELQGLPITYLDEEGEEQEIDLHKSGDPALLAGILKCIDRRCKLLGLDAPIKLDARFLAFTIKFDTPNGPRSPEDLEALFPNTNGKVIDI